MEHEKIIHNISQRELSSGLFDIKINDISIYIYIRRNIQEKVMDHYDCGLNNMNPKVSNKERKKSLRKSFWQFVRLFIQRKKFESVIRSFRVEFINDNYVDKFTDPLVDYTNLGNNCLLLEHGRSGRHLTPRRHSDKIVYTDIIYWLAWKFINIRKKHFYKKYAEKIDILFSKIESTFPEIDFNRDAYLTQIVRFCFITSCYKRLFKAIKAKRLFAPSRAGFQHLIPAAKMQGLKVYELQHGITYGESVTYSGYRDPMFTPDYFLAFGNMSKTDKYGIDINRIIVIGWAFDNYLSNIIANRNNLNDNNVLVISESHVTEKMIVTCLNLAETNTNIHFYYRPHPNELLSEEQKNRLTQYQNIHFDDNTQNILVTLHQFKHIIGENSTVLYEALSYGKKVGKLYMNGLTPKDLDKDDPNYFWRIEDADSFKEFINASPEAKKQRKIYSKFDRKVFENLISS